MNDMIYRGQSDPNLMYDVECEMRRLELIRQEIYVCDFLRTKHMDLEQKLKELRRTMQHIADILEY